MIFFGRTGMIGTRITRIKEDHSFAKQKKTNKGGRHRFALRRIEVYKIYSNSYICDHPFNQRYPCSIFLEQGFLLALRSRKKRIATKAPRHEEIIPLE